MEAHFLSGHTITRPTPGTSSSGTAQCGSHVAFAAGVQPVEHLVAHINSVVDFRSASEKLGDLYLRVLDCTSSFLSRLDNSIKPLHCQLYPPSMCPMYLLLPLPFSFFFLTPVATEKLESRCQSAFDKLDARFHLMGLVASQRLVDTCIQSLPSDSLFGIAWEDDVSTFLIHILISRILIRHKHIYIYIYIHIFRLYHAHRSFPHLSL